MVRKAKQAKEVIEETTNKAFVDGYVGPDLSDELPEVPEVSNETIVSFDKPVRATRNSEPIDQDNISLSAETIDNVDSDFPEELPVSTKKTILLTLCVEVDTINETFELDGDDVLSLTNVSNMATEDIGKYFFEKYVSNVKLFNPQIEVAG